MRLRAGIFLRLGRVEEATPLVQTLADQGLYDPQLARLCKERGLDFEMVNP